jgi:hypothetical protein
MATINAAPVRCDSGSDRAIVDINQVIFYVMGGQTVRYQRNRSPNRNDNRGVEMDNTKFTRTTTFAQVIAL